MEVSCKIGGMNLDPLQLTMWRFLISGVLMLPFGIESLRKQDLHMEAKDIIMLVGIGVLIVPLCNGLFQIAVMNANASTVSVLVCVNPFFTMIMARIFLREKFEAYKVATLMTALCGIFLMLRFWDIQEGNTALGMISVLVSSLFFGLYAVASQATLRKIGMAAQTSFSFVFGSVVLMIILIISGSPVFGGAAENIPILLYIGLIVTGLGYYSYIKANELAGATMASYSFFIKPIFAPILAVIFLHERILWDTQAGTVLILAAILFNIIWTGKKQNERAAVDKFIVKK